MLLILDSVAADPVLPTHVVTSNAFLRQPPAQWPQAAALPELTEGGR